MNDLLHSPQAWGLILGVLAPLLISVVQQPHWSKAGKTAVAVLVSVVIGVVTVLSQDQVNTGDWLTTIALVLVASQAAYGGIYKPSGLADVIEFNTSKRQDYYDDDDFDNFAAA